MKKISLLPLLVFPLLSGCSSNNIVQLTYGTLIDEECVEINVSTFETKIDNEENFLMAIYPDQSTCSCWSNFERVINKAMSNSDILIYKFPVSKVSSSTTMKEMGGFYEINNAPTFYIIKNKEIAYSYRYNSTNPLFTNEEGFLEEINSHCKLPKLILANKEQIDEKINLSHSNILFLKNSCSDCNYMIPHALIPYFDSHNLEEVIYGFDIEVYESDKEEYQNIKDMYGLSNVNNPNLGYNSGYVPTIQHYENGNLIDMGVYFNDGVLNKKEDSYYYLSDSFYNADRSRYLHYLDEESTKDFTSIQIKEEDTVLYGEKRYWKSSSSAIYHNQNLYNFLDYYLK